MTKADTLILKVPFYRPASDLEPKFFVRSGAAAAALVIYGALVIVSSQLRPTFKKDGGAAMPAEMQRTCHGVSRTHSAFVCNLSSDAAIDT